MLNMIQRYTFGVVAFLILAAPGSTFAQQVRDRQLTPSFDFTTIQMPVEILTIKLNGREIQPGERVKGGDDWLRGLSFTLKNISDEPLAYVSVVLRFPGAEGVFVGYFLSYGVDLSRGLRREGSSPPAIQPGQTVDLVLTKEEYQTFQSLLAQGGASSSFDTAPYFIGRICLENDRDVIWEAGYLKRRDQNRPTEYNVIGRYALPTQQK